MAVVLFSKYQRRYKIHKNRESKKISKYHKTSAMGGGLQRVGGENDGGYVMAKPNPENNATAISLGVSSYSPWDLEMANMGYKVLQYDGSINKGPYNHPNITFYKNFVGTKDSDDTITLQTIIKQNNINPNAHNILQCDIENHEWDMLENIDLEMISSHFIQIIFEFHHCNPENHTKSQRRFCVLENINKYFTPIHVHFNNYGKIFYSKGLFLSDVFEVSYINNKLIESKEYKSGFCTIIGLDAPNSTNFPEIPVIFPK